MKNILIKEIQMNKCQDLCLGKITDRQSFQ